MLGKEYLLATWEVILDLLSVKNVFGFFMTMILFIVEVDHKTITVYDSNLVNESRRVPIGMSRFYSS